MDLVKDIIEWGYWQELGWISTALLGAIGLFTIISARIPKLGNFTRAWIQDILGVTMLDHKFSVYIINHEEENKKRNQQIDDQIKLAQEREIQRDEGVKEALTAATEASNAAAEASNAVKDLAKTVHSHVRNSVRHNPPRSGRAKPDASST